MKNLKKIAIFFASAVFTAGLFAESVTIAAKDGNVTINVPAEIANIIRQNQAQIEQALNEHNIEGDIVTDVANRATSVYDEKGTAIIGTATKGLDGFCEDLCDSLPNSQTQQNVWAEAWIGKLLPFPHLGFGINAGASEMDISALKNAAKALSIDVKDLKNSYVLPTVTADVRLGGIIFPFDVGLTAMSIDTSKLGSMESAMDPVSFDFFTVGGDVRYALLQGGGIRPKVSVGGGFYYTDGSVNVKDDTADASLDFKSTTLFASAQASVKLICLVPFAGGRVLLSKTSVDWNVKPQWDRIISVSDANQKQAICDIMPKSFSGSGNSGFFEDIHPQLFGGLGIDLLILNVTASLSYDVASKIPGGALSVRLAL